MAKYDRLVKKEACQDRGLSRPQRLIKTEDSHSAIFFVNFDFVNKRFHCRELTMKNSQKHFRCHETVKIHSTFLFTRYLLAGIMGNIRKHCAVELKRNPQNKILTNRVKILWRVFWKRLFWWKNEHWGMFYISVR